MPDACHRHNPNTFTTILRCSLYRFKGICNQKVGCVILSANPSQLHHEFPARSKLDGCYSLQLMPIQETQNSNKFNTGSFLPTQLPRSQFRSFNQVRCMMQLMTCNLRNFRNPMPKTGPTHDTPIFIPYITSRLPNLKQTEMQLAHIL